MTLTEKVVSLIYLNTRIEAQNDKALNNDHFLQNNMGWNNIYGLI